MCALLESLADNKYVLGRRYAEWCTGAPMLESAVAAAAMAQDELGHARSFYPLLRGFGGRDLPQMEEQGWQERPPSAMACLDAALRRPGRTSWPPTWWSTRRSPRCSPPPSIRLRAAAPARAQDRPGRSRPRRPRPGLAAPAGARPPPWRASGTTPSPGSASPTTPSSRRSSPPGSSAQSPDQLRATLRTRLEPALRQLPDLGAALLAREVPWSRWDAAARRLPSPRHSVASRARPAASRDRGRTSGSAAPRVRLCDTMLARRPARARDRDRRRLGSTSASRPPARSTSPTPAARTPGPPRAAAASSSSAAFSSASLAWLATGGSLSPRALGWLAGALLIAAVGFADDLRSLPVVPRLLAQLLAAILLTVAAVQERDFSLRRCPWRSCTSSSRPTSTTSWTASTASPPPRPSSPALALAIAGRNRRQPAARGHRRAARRGLGRLLRLQSAARALLHGRRRQHVSRLQLRGPEPARQHRRRCGGRLPLEFGLVLLAPFLFDAS